MCEQLWVVDDGAAVAFDGGYRAWRTAVAAGWTVASADRGPGGAPARCRGRRGGGTAAAASRARATGRVPPARRRPRPARRARPAAAATATRAKRGPKLSKDAYRRQKAAVDAELTRLGLRKSHLELALGDPAVGANYVELRRVSSELADVEQALGAAEDAWLELEERAP